MLALLLRWLGGGALDRILDTVDRRVQAEQDRDRIKGEVIKAHLASRAGWMAAGGFWLLLMWSVVALSHYAAVTVYSILWCARCAYPQPWTIAALPPPMSEWQGWIVMASIGGLGLLRLGRP
jgi:hypothetical protein